MSAFNFLLPPSLKKIYSKQCCSRRYQIARWQSFKELLFGFSIHCFFFCIRLFYSGGGGGGSFCIGHWVERQSLPAIVRRCTTGTSLIRASLALSDSNGQYPPDTDGGQTHTRTRTHTRIKSQIHTRTQTNSRIVKTLTFCIMDENCTAHTTLQKLFIAFI